MLIEPIKNFTNRVMVIDYGMSNLFSISNALKVLGCVPVVTSNPADLKQADKIMIPGVGSFNAGMKNLTAIGMSKAIQDAASEGIQILGICLGMQLLADEGFEHGNSKGLGLVHGEVVKMESDGSARIPHIGWNEVDVHNPSNLFEGMGSIIDFYFVHSYKFVVASNEFVSGSCLHGDRFVASVANRNVFGVQFHPERSHSAGLQVLKNFLSLPCSK